MKKTKEELWEKFNELVTRASHEEDDLYDLVQWATEGMIELPPESEWPEWAAGIQISYVSKGYTESRDLLFIGKTKPAWTPQPDDVVAFFMSSDDPKSIPFKTVYSEVNLQKMHYAKIEELSDIGKDIAWLRANRSWI